MSDKCLATNLDLEHKIHRILDQFNIKKTGGGLVGYSTSNAYGFDSHPFHRSNFVDAKGLVAARPADRNLLSALTRELVSGFTYPLTLFVLEGYTKRSYIHIWHHSVRHSNTNRVGGWSELGAEYIPIRWDHTLWVQFPFTLIIIKTCFPFIH